VSGNTKIDLGIEGFACCALEDLNATRTNRNKNSFLMTPIFNIIKVANF
jgi:hypothetical protein